MKGKTGLGPDMEFGSSGLRDGFSGLDLGFVVGVLFWESLLFGGVVVELGEGLGFTAPEGLWSALVAAAEEEDSQRDLRCWEWAEKEE